MTSKHMAAAVLAVAMFSAWPAMAISGSVQPNIATSVAATGDSSTSSGISLSFLQRTAGGYAVMVSDIGGSRQRIVIDGPQVTNESHPSWTHDGSAMVFRDRDGKLQLSRDGGRSFHQVADQQYSAPRLSPDGQHLVVESRNDVTGSQLFGLVKKRTPEVYSIDTASGRAVRLTNNEADDLAPDWSPDSSHIVFASTRDGKSDLYSMDAAGGNVRRLTQTDQSEAAPVWSPDGSRIAFVRDGKAVWVMNADGTSPRQLYSASRGQVDTLAWTLDSLGIVAAGDGKLFSVDAGTGGFVSIGAGECPAVMSMYIIDTQYDVSGYVSKPFGSRKGVPFATLRVTPYAGGPEIAAALTDESGYWEVTGLSDAVQVTLASAQSFRFPNRTQLVVPRLYNDSPQTVNFEAADDRYQARGAVTYVGDDGKATPLRNVRIRIYYYDDDQERLSSVLTYTNAAGEFTTGPVRGTALVAPELSGYAFSPNVLEVSGAGATLAIQAVKLQTTPALSPK